METSPKISIIVPVYKVEKYLRRCLDSIVAQTFTDWECILIDDGSPDNSGKICDEYAEKDGRFRVIHQENAGVSAARNAGLEVIKGKYCMFVDSDDTLKDNSLLKIVNVLNDNKADIYIFQTTYYKEKGCIDESNFFRNKNTITADEYIKAMLTGTTSVGPVSKVFISETAKKVIFDKKLKIGEDFLFLLTYALMVSNQICVSHFSTYNYLYNPASATHTLDYSKEEPKFFEKMNDLFHQKGLYEKYEGYLSACIIHRIFTRSNANGRLPNREEQNEMLVHFTKCKNILGKKYKIYLAIAKFSKKTANLMLSFCGWLKKK